MNQNYLLTAIKAGHNELVRKLVENGINTIYEYAYLAGCTGITSLSNVTFRGYANLTGCQPHIIEQVRNMGVNVYK